jgi:transcriptional regulator with XRE-family HTH domain
MAKAEKGKKKRKLLNPLLKYKQKDVARKLKVHISQISLIWKNISGGSRWPSQKIEFKKAHIGLLMNRKETLESKKNNANKKKAKLIGRKIRLIEKEIDNTNDEVKELMLNDTPIYLDEHF